MPEPRLVAALGDCALGCNVLGDPPSPSARSRRSCPSTSASRAARRRPAQIASSASARRRKRAPHREVQPEHDVLVVERDAQRLLDPAQPQVQRLALEVQRPRRLGLAPARRQVGLERLQQRARARRASPSSGPSCSSTNASSSGVSRRSCSRSATPGRRASCQRATGSAVAAPAERRTRRRPCPAATHVSAGAPIASAASRRAEPVAVQRAVEEVGDVLGQRRVVAARAEREQHQQVDVARAEQHGEARSRRARCAGRRTAASR